MWRLKGKASAFASAGNQLNGNDGLAANGQLNVIIKYCILKVFIGAVDEHKQ